MGGHRGHAEPVNVTQHQRRPVRRIEPRQHPPRQARIDRPGLDAPSHRRRGVRHRQLAVVACLGPPMIDELVAGHADQPRHIHHLAGRAAVRTGHEHVLGQILHRCPVTDTAGQYE